MSEVQQNHNHAQISVRKIACRSCRARKVRCGRELPQCFNCLSHDQTCVYPPRSLKPGPKLGTIHKRRRLEDHHLFLGNIDGLEVAEEQRLAQDQTSKPKSIPLCTTDAIDVSQIQDINALIRLRHEPFSPNDTDGPVPPPEFQTTGQDLSLLACEDLGVPPTMMSELLKVFFSTFTSFRLFREPVFSEKLGQISSPLHVKALLAIIFAFACKAPDGDMLIRSIPLLNSTRFAQLAGDYVETALKEYEDDPPPLHFLQAFILVTHWRIIKGVRSRAWRDVGLCIRIAFEISLNTVDANKNQDFSSSDVARWCDQEEKRRAYWAIFEMDQFTNALKQVIVSLDWTSNQVYLPVEDEKWFSGEIQQSCPLPSDLMERPKILSARGNKSGKAWYLVMCSLLREAYDLAYNHYMTDLLLEKRNGDDQTARAREVEIRYSILLNALHLTQLLLPSGLKFQYQRLDFTNSPSTRFLDTISIHDQQSIFQLAVLPCVARLVASRPFVLRCYAKRLSGAYIADKNSEKPQTEPDSLHKESEKTRQCFDAADAILDIEAHCGESHYYYVNPYFAHASWLASTVQLLRLQSAEDDAEKTLVRSKIEVLEAMNSHFVKHWGISAVLKHNLDQLTIRLNAITNMSKGRLWTQRCLSDSQDPVSSRHIVHATQTRDNPDKSHQLRASTSPKPLASTRKKGHLETDGAHEEWFHVRDDDCHSSTDASAFTGATTLQPECLSSQCCPEENFAPSTEAVLAPNGNSQFNDMLDSHSTMITSDMSGIAWPPFYDDLENIGGISSYLDDLLSWSAGN